MQFFALPHELRLLVYDILMDSLCSRAMTFDNLSHRPLINNQVDHIPKPRAYPFRLCAADPQLEQEFLTRLGAEIKVKLIVRSLYHPDLLDDLKARFNFDPSR